MPSKHPLISILISLLILLPFTSSQNPLKASHSVEISDISSEEKVTSTNSISFKNSCEPGYYLYSNGTCSPQCEAPFVIQEQNGALMCQEPQGKSISTNKAPQRLRSLQESQTIPAPSDSDSTTAPSSSFSYWSALINSEEASYASSALSLLSTIIQPGNPGPLLQILNSQLISTMKYMNINDLQEEEDLQIILAPIQMNLGFQIPQDWTDKFASSQSLQGLNSNYLVNDWKNLTTYIFMLIIIGALSLTNFVRDALKLTGKSISKHLYTAFKWNIALVIFFSGLYELVLFSSIELLTFKSQRIPNIISLITCLTMVIIAFLVILKLFHLTKKSRRSSLSTPTDLTFANNDNSFQILFSGFSQSNPLNRRFLLISLLRTIKVSILIIPLHAFPLSQASINVIMSCAMMIYLIRNKPLVSRLNFIQSILLETGLLLINLSTLGLTLAQSNQALGLNITNILKIILLIQSFNIKFCIVLSFLSNIYQAYRTEFPAKATTNPTKLDTIKEVSSAAEQENDNIRLVIGSSSSQFATPRGTLHSLQSQNTPWKRLRISGMIDLDIESDYQMPNSTRGHRHTPSTLSGSESRREMVSRKQRRVRTMAPESQVQRGHF